jgi:hypothetical protein
MRTPRPPGIGDGRVPADGAKPPPPHPPRLPPHPTPPGALVGRTTIAGRGKHAPRYTASTTANLSASKAQVGVCQLQERLVHIGVLSMYCFAPGGGLAHLNCEERRKWFGDKNAKRSDGSKQAYSSPMHPPADQQTSADRHTWLTANQVPQSSSRNCRQSTPT